MAKKINIEDIDENFIISSFKPDNTIPLPAPAVEITDPVVKKEVPRRKNKLEYEERFLQESDFIARLGKSAYIRPEYYKKLQKIVRIIGCDKVSVFSLVDNILQNHFETYNDLLQELYEKNNESKL